MISLLLPSRGRWRQLMNSCANVLLNADEPGQVEILVACDPDDYQTAQVQVTNTTIYTVPERYGYLGFHKYSWFLSQHARGEWLMNWDDCAFMRTRGWDKIITRRNPAAILWPDSNMPKHANCFPVWPKAWTDAIGHIAPFNHVDTYLQRIGEQLGRQQHIPIQIHHERPDTTGAPQDDTYREGRGLLGSEGMSGELDYVQLAADVKVINALL